MSGKKKKVPTRPHLAKAPTIASEKGFPNFTALVSRNMPRYNKMMTNKIRFTALFTEQQRLPPTWGRLLLKTVKKHEYFHTKEGFCFNSPATQANRREELSLGFRNHGTDRVAAQTALLQNMLEGKGMQGYSKGYLHGNDFLNFVHLKLSL